MGPKDNPEADTITHGTSEEILTTTPEQLALRAALRRLAKGPYGGVLVDVLDQVRGRLVYLSKANRDCQQKIESEKQFLRQSKGPRAYLIRLKEPDRRDTELNSERRAVWLAIVEQAADELERQTRGARAEIDHCRGQIKSIRYEARDLLVSCALGEQWRSKGERKPNYAEISRALDIDDRSLPPPKTPLKNLVSLAKREIRDGRGEARWPITMEVLSWMTEEAATIEPENH
jgi:predicted RNA-binding protein YlxR (DUF448 family)